MVAVGMATGDAQSGPVSAVAAHSSTDPAQAATSSTPIRYACRTKIIAGLGSLSTLPGELDKLAAKRPVLVVDCGIDKAGLLDRWLPRSITADWPRILAGVNPTSEAVEEAAQKAREAQCDSVVIVGGGSALCLGKAVGILLSNPGRILDYQGSDRVPLRPVPTIAIPTVR